MVGILNSKDKKYVFVVCIFLNIIWKEEEIMERGYYCEIIEKRGGFNLR